MGPFNMKIIFLFLISFFSLSSQADGQTHLTESLKSLPVQDAGRVKPFDSFAREALHLIYGKQTYLSEKDGDIRPASEIVMTWILQPTAWAETPLFEIRFGALKKALKLVDERKLYSFNEISNNERFPTLMQELASKRETKEKLDPYFQAVQRLESQLLTFREIASGRLFRIVPPQSGDTWLALPDLPLPLQTQFIEVTKSFVSILGALTAEAPADQALKAREDLKKSVSEFKRLARAENPSLYPDDRLMRVELHYNEFHPFKWAWIFYLLGAIFCMLVWTMGKEILYKPAWGFSLIGLGFHIYGFALRIYLMGRPPVTNMYETVVWVGFGAVVFAMVIEATYRWRFILFAGSLVGAFCLALADAAPVVLDASLQPLEPVLRNNFWLLIHVMTITISYAAFFLAFVLGDIGLVYYLKGEEKNKAKLKAVTLAIYRSMQIGISFLAPGIILGGIWADYSWGRFWGWDPKETWALIALLGYLAVLHGRMAGILKDFGMACAAVITFSLVIMAWYGVNFILGAGLHSYGFGAGGVEYVALFVAVHLLFVIFTSVVRFGRLKEKKTSA